LPDNSDIFKNPAPGIAPDGQILKSAKIDYKAEYERLQAERRRLEQKVELPFLYGWKWYSWAYDFFESTNKVNLLCAANQISKSSTQIRKCIDWATNTEKWPRLWRSRPYQFWYLYPTRDVVNAEFETKWKPQFLPNGAMKDDPYYGWKEERKGVQGVIAIHFNSGVHVYFKTYAQDVSALQTGTCDAIFCDEELPIDMYDELMHRLNASDGYFHMVFTATMGQDFWRRALEPLETEKEELPDAFKQVVSLYDAMTYTDGTHSHWTIEKIQAIERRCSSENEIQKRVHGRFILIGGRKYENYDARRHFKKSHPIPESWLIYEGVDLGSGGKSGHKAAIVFVAVSPDFRKGRVFLGWRGEKGVQTTAGDVFKKHLEMKSRFKLNPTQKWYDWGNADFGIIATRAGDPFEKADKSHEKGEEILNTLFKHDMLLIYDDEDGQLVHLSAELTVLKKDTPKRKAVDDYSDGLRYAVTKIPWDWSFLAGAKVEEEAPDPEAGLTEVQRQILERRKAFDDGNQKEQDRIDAEFAEWNDAYGN